MKFIQKLIIVVLGFCWGIASYAVNGPLTFEKSYTYSREPAYSASSGTCAKPSFDGKTFWGTDKVNGNDGKQLVKYASTGSKIGYPKSNIDNLTPKGRTNKPFAYKTIEQIWPLPDGSVLFAAETNDNYSYLYKFKNGNVGNNPVAKGSIPAYGNKQAVLNMGERQIKGGVSPGPNIRTLHHRSILVATINCATVLFYGEYNVSKDKRLALWKSTDMGDTWSIAFEWNKLAQQTFHIHGVVQNPFNGWIYILFGDYDSEAAIVAWDGKSPAKQSDNPSPAQMKNYPGWKSIAGSKRVKTGDLTFTPPKPAGTGKIIWIPDIDFLQAGDDFTGGDTKKSKGVLYSQQANYDLTGLQAAGAIPKFKNGFSPIIGTRSTQSGNIYWSSFRIATNTLPVPPKEIYLWRSIDSGLTWTQDVKVPLYTDIGNDVTTVPSDIYVNSDSTGTDHVSLVGNYLELVKGGARYGSTAVYKNPGAAVIPVAKHDNYLNSSIKSSRVQIINVSVLNGVGKNDLPVNDKNRIFALVPNSLKRLDSNIADGGTGKGSVAVSLNTAGAFRFTVAARTNTKPTEYWKDKLGTYQFKYTMLYKGLKTAPATVTMVLSK